MVSTPVAIAEMSATEAASIALASNPLAPIFAKIREAAKNGHYSLTLGGAEISTEGIDKLKKLGYKVEGGRSIIISWHRW